MSSTEQQLADFLSGRLHASADRLVDRWIGWVRGRIDNPTIEALPERALRNHIPPVLASLGSYLADPTHAIRSEMLGHLRLHAQMRRDQGYSVQDLLAEFDGLAHLVTVSLRHDVEQHPDARLADALAVFTRLATGLRAIAFVTVGVFEEGADQRRQDLAAKLSDFAHAVSHELRSPVQAAMLGSMILLDERFTDDAATRKRQAEMIRASMQRIEGLLEDVDLLASTERAGAQPRLGALPGLLEEIREELVGRARSKGVRLEFPDQVPRLAVERVVAQLVLVNVINNAVKYSDPGKTDRWVRVRASISHSDETPFACLEVEDNGLGIPEDYQTRLFQRGFRAHPDVAEGAGLGLTICQELLLERGGEVELSSEEGRGTMVRFTLRATDAEAVAATGADDLMRDTVRALLDMEELGPEQAD
ncbi:MAG: ATP-binding protein [Pseudomonadales bacterium]